MADRTRNARRAVGAFRAHLASSKFQGTEYACPHCGRLLDPDTTCIRCGSKAVGERKDWISTADVLRYLDTIDDALQYDLPELIDRG